MGEPIRVLQVIGIVAGGGVESVIMNYYDHIDHTKVQFDFIVHNDNKIDITDKVEKMGGRVYKVTPYYKNPIAFMWDIYKVIIKGHYQIVHSNMNTLSAFPLFAAWLAGVPVRILHNHSTSSPGETKRNMMKFILRPFAKLFANRYFACSYLAGEWMYGKKMMDSGKVIIINNAIDLKKYAFDPEKRKALRKELGLKNEFVVGHVGRFMFQKNHDFLIDVFAEVLKKCPQAMLLLIGDGPLKSKIENKVKLLGIESHVKFLGLRKDVQNLYNVMDLFVLPSHYEGLPVVGVEAQVNGLPLLVSDCVTQEMQKTSIVTYESLSNGSKVWSEQVLTLQQKYANGKLHENTYEEMQRAGFDIIKEAKKLEEIELQEMERI